MIFRHVLLVVMLVLGGCRAYTPHPVAEIPGGMKVYRDEAVYLGRDYLISPGDEMEILYHLNVDLQDSYRLAVGDQMRVEFYHYPQLDRTLDVRPDGKITIPYKGDIKAAGLTPEQLSKRINDAFADTLRESKSTVTLIRYGQRMRDLKDAIKTAARGQSRLVLVAPDGKASMPLITPLRVAGKTIEQSEKEIDAAYQKIIPGMKTSATLLNVKGNVVYVFGAVNRPGFYEMRGPTTTLQAVISAGGFTPNAETSSTLLISRDEESHAVGRLINLAEVMSTGNIGKDTMVRQSDVVFVPNTKLSEAALVADFIRRLIPFSLSATYGIAENMNNGPVTRLLNGQ